MRTCRLCICNIAISDRSSASAPTVAEPPPVAATAAARRLEAEPEPAIALVCGTAAARVRVPLEPPETTAATTGDGVVNASRERLLVSTGSRDGVVVVDAVVECADERRRLGGTRPK